VHRLAVLACLAACGRFGFGDDTSSTGDDGGSRGDAADALVPTGPIGPRWIAKFTNDGSSTVVGRNGEVAILSRFNATFNADPAIALLAQGYISTAFVRYDATGAPLYSTVLDSDGFCDMRAAVLDGDVIYATGLTQGTQAIPAYGACSIATNRQDPVAIRIDSQNNQSVVAHWTAGGGNAQAWYLALMPDHTLTISGIYSSGLMIGPYMMPTGVTDPSYWIARTTTTTATDAAWARGFTASVEIHSGPVASDGDDVCVMGAHSGSTNVFGSALSYVGNYDAWVARVDGSGTARFVRAFGSPGLEASFEDGTLLALPDGGCLAALRSTGDITLDTGTYPVSQGDGLLVRFAQDGTVTHARRFSTEPAMTFVGTRLIAAYDQGGDAHIVEVDLQGGADHELAVIGGSGTQTPFEVAAIGPDAVAVTVTTNGALSFGATSFDTGATTMRAVAVLGI
jgi:hypothetical protein